MGGLRADIEAAHVILKPMFEGLSKLAEIHTVFETLLQAVERHDEQVEANAASWGRTEEQFAKLTERLAAAEGVLRSGQDTIENQAAQVERQTALMNDLQPQVAAASAAASARQADAAIMSDRVAKLEASVDDNARRVPACVDACAKLEAQLQEMHVPWVAAQSDGGWAKAAEMEAVAARLEETAAKLVDLAPPVDAAVAEATEARTMELEVLVGELQAQVKGLQSRLEQVSPRFPVEADTAGALSAERSVDGPQSGDDTLDAPPASNRTRAAPDGATGAQVSQNAQAIHDVHRDLKRMDSRMKAVDAKIKSLSDKVQGIEKKVAGPAAQAAQAEPPEGGWASVAQLDVLASTTGKIEAGFSSVQRKVGDLAEIQLPRLKEWATSEVKRLEIDLEGATTAASRRTDIETQERIQQIAELRDDQAAFGGELKRIELQFSSITTNCLSCGASPRPPQHERSVTGSDGHQYKDEMAMSGIIGREWEFSPTRTPLRKGGGFQTSATHFFSSREKDKERHIQNMSKQTSLPSLQKLAPSTP